MCGIVAGVSGRDIVPVLVQGLQRLEYRGYDSCGVAVHQDRQHAPAVAVGEVVVDEADRLHQGVHRGGADVGEPGGPASVARVESRRIAAST